MEDEVNREISEDLKLNRLLPRVYVHQVLHTPPPPEDHRLQNTLPEFFKVILWLLYLYLQLIFCAEFQIHLLSSFLLQQTPIRQIHIFQPTLYIVLEFHHSICSCICK